MIDFCGEEKNVFGWIVRKRMFWFREKWFLANK